MDVDTYHLTCGPPTHLPSTSRTLHDALWPRQKIPACWQQYEADFGGLSQHSMMLPLLGWMDRGEGPTLDKCSAEEILLYCMYYI